MLDKKIYKSTIQAYYVSLVMDKYKDIEQDILIQTVLRSMLKDENYSDEDIELFIETFNIKTAMMAAETADFVSIIEDAVRQLTKIEPKSYGDISRKVDLMVARKFSKIFGEDVSIYNVEVYKSLTSTLKRLDRMGRVRITINPDNERYYLYQHTDWVEE